MTDVSIEGKLEDLDEHLEPIDRISPNVISAFILARSSSGLLHIIFCIFVAELWPFIYTKNSFPLNILRTNR